jgi:tetrapyrrole methylase family protein / MazG family protein
MKEFHQLIEVIDKLMSPEGCPWDREQTLPSLRKCVLEEVHELIEAIDLDDRDKILEELGDLFFNAVFFCKVAEKEKIFSTEDVLQQIINKLIRRHPHVFGDAKINNTEELLVQWNKIKNEEQGNKRKSVMDAIPAGYPALGRAQRVVHLMKKASYPHQPKNEEPATFSDEASLGETLMHLLVQAESLGIDAELALKNYSSKQEKAFRSWEEKTHG